MNRRLLQVLACPGCEGNLTIAESALGEDDDIVDATLACDHCDARYPVVEGIPRFVSRDHDTSFGLQWNRFRLEQLDSFTGQPLSADRFWSETDWEPDWLQGKWILDAGCGAGRFLEVASRAGCEIVGLDVSSAVDAAQSSLRGRGNVHLVQADIYEMPFKRGVFDGCYSIGVLQHTPDPLRAARSLVRPVKPRGRVAVTVYERRRWTRFYSKYLIRRWTSRMDPERLLRIIELSMPVLFPLTTALFRLPIAGRVFRFIMPLANYVEIPDFSRQMRYRWAIMDTFDMLAPRWDEPQTETALRHALEDENLREVRRTTMAGLSLSGVVSTSDRATADAMADASRIPG